MHMSPCHIQRSTSMSQCHMQRANLHVTRHMQRANLHIANHLIPINQRGILEGARADAEAVDAVDVHILTVIDVGRVRVFRADGLYPVLEEVCDFEIPAVIDTDGTRLLAAQIFFRLQGDDFPV